MPEPAARHIALAGNPNCGKTTLFNALTGLRQKVGNYPGVTVERKTGRGFGSHGEPLTFIDLPGSYSLQPRSPDEEISRNVLLGRRSDTPRPDLIVAVVDASALERHLYLVAQLLDLGLPVVLALNMVDVAERRGLRVDVVRLEAELGIPVIPLVASRGVGLIPLRQALSRPVPAPACRAPVPPELEREALALAPQLGAPPATAWAEALLALTAPEPGPPTAAAARARLRQAGVEPLAALVQARYEWLGRLCAQVVRGPNAPLGESVSDRVDRVLTHRLWGWLALGGLFLFLFFCIFSVAQAPMEWIDSATGALGEWLSARLPESDVRSLLVDGVVAGVGGVVIFLPQILILFFFLGLLEDSGYMARAAFLMDRAMASVGLHGKSFIPLLGSYACAIPGIMATRTIENRKDRLVTLLVAPLMSCSARLPVYGLMIALLLPDTSAWAKAGLMAAMYILGTGTAFGMAWLFKRTLLKGETPALLMELPPYRLPAWRNVALQMGERAGLFLKRAGSVILALSILLWALATYPKAPEGATPGEAIAQSYAGQMGHAIEPVIRPLGYDWRIGIGLIGSFAARELFVGTMGIVYSVEGEVDEANPSLLEQLRAAQHADGAPVYTPLVCLGLMVFYVLAMQCISTVAVVRRETNSWRWPLFQLAYMTALAWVGAWAVYQGGRLLGWQ